MILPTLGSKRMQRLIPTRLMKSSSRIHKRLVKPIENSTFPSHRASSGRASSPNRIGARLLAVLWTKLIPRASNKGTCSNSSHVRSPRNSQLTEPSDKITRIVCADSEPKAVTTAVRSSRLEAIDTVAMSNPIASNNFNWNARNLLFSFKGAIGIGHRSIGL